MDVGFVPSHKSTPIKQSKFIYLLGADDLQPNDLPSEAFVVYQGHHGDVGAQYADVVLPASAYTEKSATFVNTEGRPQLTRSAVSAPGQSREDWKIVRALSELAGETLPYDDIYSLRERLSQLAPHLARYDHLEESGFSRLGLQALATGKKSPLSKQPLVLPIENFWMTDSISRSSVTMAKCSATFNKVQ